METRLSAVEIWGDVLAVRNFIYVDDLVEGVLRLVDISHFLCAFTLAATSTVATAGASCARRTHFDRLLFPALLLANCDAIVFIEKTTLQN